MTDHRPALRRDPRDTDWSSVEEEPVRRGPIRPQLWSQEEERGFDTGRFVATVIAILVVLAVAWTIAEMRAAPSEGRQSSSRTTVGLRGAPSWLVPVGAASLGQAAVAAGVGAPAQLGTVLLSGTATWYCGHGSACTRGYSGSELIGAIDPTLGIPKGTWVTVRHAGREVRVLTVDVCLCSGRRLIDLSSGAFARLAPLSAGVISIELEVGERRPLPTLPPTDMEETR